LIGIAVEFALLGLLVYLPIPFLHNLFNTAPLGWQEWMFLIIIPIVMLLADEVRKCVLQKWDYLHIK
jgi:Ca2+-transporting ATPase